MLIVEAGRLVATQRLDAIYLAQLFFGSGEHNEVRCANFLGYGNQSEACQAFKMRENRRDKLADQRLPMKILVQSSYSDTRVLKDQLREFRSIFVVHTALPKDEHAPVYPLIARCSAATRACSSSWLMKTVSACS